MNDGTNTACQDTSTLRLQCHNSWAIHLKQSSVLSVYLLMLVRYYHRILSPFSDLAILALAL